MAKQNIFHIFQRMVKLILSPDNNILFKKFNQINSIEFFDSLTTTTTTKTTIIRIFKKLNEYGHIRVKKQDRRGWRNDPYWGSVDGGWVVMTMNGGGVSGSFPTPHHLHSRWSDAFHPI
jgi:hypothetical protein